MADIHSSMEMNKDPFKFIKSDFQEDSIKQDIKEEDDYVSGNTSDVNKKETGNSEGIKQDLDDICSCLDIKPVLFKQELTDVENETSKDKQKLSSWSFHSTDAVILREENREDKQILTTADLLDMKIKSSGL